MFKDTFKKFLGYLAFFIVFTILVIIGITFTSKNKKIKITHVLKNLESIDNGFLDLQISKKTQIEENTEKINIVYKTLFDKTYNDEEFLAVDGSLGIEVESMQIGIYLPIKIIMNDNIDFFTEIDEVYQTIIEIPENNTKMKAQLLPIIKTFYPDLDISLLKADLVNILIKYLKQNKNNFNYVKSDEQFYLFTKGIGRFNKNISEIDFNNLNDILKETCDENSNNYKTIKSYLDKLRGEYSLYIYVKNNQIYKIEFFNDELFLTLSLKNVNFNKDLEIPDRNDKYGLDFNDYLDKNNFNLLSLIGLNEDGTLNLKNVLQKNFKELISYMYLCIQYSEAGDNNSAQKYIELMTALIDSIENTENISEIDIESFKNYIDVYKLLRQYTIIYNQQCFTTDENMINELDEKLFETVISLTDKMNSLGIDINETFNMSEDDLENSLDEKEIITIGIENNNENVIDISEKIEDNKREEKVPIIITPEETNEIEDTKEIITIGVEDVY